MDRAKGFIGVKRGAFADTFLCEFETEDGTDLSAILIDVELPDGTTESRRYVPERTCHLEECEHERIKDENEKLKNDNNYLHEMLSESRQANERLYTELKRHKSILRARPNAMTALYDENAKLREFATRLLRQSLEHTSNVITHDILTDEARELGIEVCE